jgi:hypothetical protein
MQTKDAPKLPQKQQIRSIFHAREFMFFKRIKCRMSFWLGGIGI